MSAKLNDFSCPFCDHQMDAVTGVNTRRRKPRDGNLSVCIQCGEPAIFVKRGRIISLRKPTIEEYSELMEDANLLSAIQTIKHINAIFRLPPEREKETE